MPSIEIKSQSVPTQPLESEAVTPPPVDPKVGPEVRPCLLGGLALGILFGDDIIKATLPGLNSAIRRGAEALKAFANSQEQIAHVIRSELDRLNINTSHALLTKDRQGNPSLHVVARNPLFHLDSSASNGASRYQITYSGVPEKALLDIARSLGVEAVFAPPSIWKKIIDRAVRTAVGGVAGGLAGGVVGSVFRSGKEGTVIGAHMGMTAVFGGEEYIRQSLMKLPQEERDEKILAYQAALLQTCPQVLRNWFNSILRGMGIDPEQFSPDNQPVRPIEISAPISTYTATITNTPETPLPTVTLTPKPSATRTWTSLPTITFTPTASETPTPTETPVPKYIWISDFENGMASYLGQEQVTYGGTITVIDDPTNSGHGKVLYSYHHGETPIETRTGERNIRLHAGITFPDFLRGSYSASVDVYLYGNISPAPDHPWTEHDCSFLSDFTYFTGAKIGDLKYGKADVLTLFVVPDDRGKNVLTHRTFDKKHKSVQPTYVNPNAPEFFYDRWHRINYVVSSDRTVSIFQDGILVTKGIIPDDMQVGIMGTHAGFYGEIFDHAEMLVDNHIVTSYGAV